MNIKRKIILAIVSNCHNTRQIADYLDCSLSTINNYFYNSSGGLPMKRIENDDLIKWQPGKANTIRRGPNLATIIHKGSIIAIGRVEIF